MSNYLAIAAVTSTFSQWLLEKAASVVDGAKTNIGRPKDGAPKGINIFLYQVAYNTDRRNDDLPTRRGGDATVAQRPQAALDLYFLLTFYGTEKDLEPQILLGSTVSALHAQPILTPTMLRSEINRRIMADPGDSLAKFDVASLVQSITFTPLSYNVEELSKLWSMLYQIPYTLSVAYKASVIFIESDVVPQKALPVLRPDVYVLPFRRPLIEKIVSSDGETAPIVYNSKLILTGRQLKGDPTKVRIGEVEVTLDPTDTVNTVSDTQIALSLSSTLFSGKSFRAGVQGVLILHPVMMGDPMVEHYGFESNVKPLVFSPTIISQSISGTDMTLEIKPNVGKTQKVTALLNEYESASARPHAYALKAPADNGITSESETETDSITFSVADVEPGKYLLRVQVDSAESSLLMGSGPNPKYASPQVTIS